MTSAAAVVAAMRDDRAEPQRAGADRGGRGHGVPRPVRQLLGFAAAVVGIDDLLRFAGDRVDHARAVVVEPRPALAADDPILVLTLPFGQVRGHRLPLPQIGLDQPVDQLADLALDLLRRVGHHLLLEPLLDPAAIEQIHHPADPHRLVEVVVAAALHLEQDAVDVGHPQLEVPVEILLIDGELPLDFVERRRSRP